MAGALRWALRASHPERARHREWVLQELGIAGLFYRQRHAGGRLYPLSPAFLGRVGRPLVDPPVVPAAQASHLREDDVVLGVELGERARAYPWWLLDDHHFANDELDGTPLVIMLCEQCSTGLAFERLADGEPLTFRLSHVFNGTIAMEDEETRSLWSPYLGRAIRGRLEGRELRPFPLWQMEWRAWRELHPDTDVLAEEVGERHGHGSDHHIGSAKEAPRMWGTIGHWDRRLPYNTLVLGVVTADGAKTYPLETIGSNALNDAVGTEPVVVIADGREGSYGALAFSRMLDGRTLTFAADPAGVRDLETGSTWNLAGAATEGPLAGRKLRYLPSHVSEWFVWAAHYPEIEIGTD
jgi:hypothetical protein